MKLKVRLVPLILSHAFTGPIDLPLGLSPKFLPFVSRAFPLVALKIAIVIAWWMFIALRRISVVTYRSDISDEGQSLITRNRALVNAGPVADVKTPTVDA